MSQRDKLLIWTSGSKFEPSRRYRIDCYIGFYSQHFDIVYFDDVSLSRLLSRPTIRTLRMLVSLFSADVILLQRRLLPIFLVKVLKYMGKRVVLDVDDGIHLYESYAGYPFQSLKALLAHVIIGNEYLLGYWSDKYYDCTVIPTGVEYVEYKKRSVKSDQIDFLWIGTKTNFDNLLIYYDYLQRLNTSNRFKLTVVSDTVPDFVTSEFSEFIMWHEGIEKEIEDSNVPYVGLMPLNEVNEVNLFKCSFKMLQYMNWSMPVIVTPIGMNKDLLDSDQVGFGVSEETEFHNSIFTLMSDCELYDILAKCGNQVIKSKYSRQFIRDSYLKTLKNQL